MTVRHIVLSGNIANTGQARASVPAGADARGIGGGVYNAGAITMSDTTVDHNTANTGSSSFSASGYGGGIAVEDGAMLTLYGTVVAGNLRVHTPCDITVLAEARSTPPAPTTSSESAAQAGWSMVSTATWCCDYIAPPPSAVNLAYEVFPHKSWT
jgi:hypothetical protein